MAVRAVWATAKRHSVNIVESSKKKKKRWNINKRGKKNRKTPQLELQEKQALCNLLWRKIAETRWWNNGSVHVCVSTYLHTCIHTYTYIYICVCLCLRLRLCALPFTSSNGLVLLLLLLAAAICSRVTSFVPALSVFESSAVKVINQLAANNSDASVFGALQSY